VEKSGPEFEDPFLRNISGILLAVGRGGKSGAVPQSKIIPCVPKSKTMPAKTVVNAVLLDAQKINETWMANPGFVLGEVTQKSFNDLAAQAGQLSETIEARRIEVQGLMNQRDDLVKELRTLITRARSGFRAVYGPDSTQYEQSGGTRQSERKAPGRKPATTSAKA
jgi:hypothetical protein